MKYFVCCVLLIGLATPRVAADSIKDARQRWLQGNYLEAQEQFEKLAKDAREGKERAAAVIGWSRALQSQGEYDKSLAVIDDAVKAQADNAELLARRAEILYFRGRWEDAEKAAEQAIALSKDHLLARWVRAQIYRERGDLKKADAEFRWFVRTYTERSNNDNDIKDPEELLLVGLAGAENARWNNLSDQFSFILTEVYGDALKNDKNFWPAELQAGLLLLEKYNRGEALPAFDKALTINPNAAEALVGKGIAALQKFEIKEAESFAEQALKINVKLPEALRLRADVHLASGDAAKALAELAEARKVNPRDEATLGRVAACLKLQRKQEEFDALAKEVEQFDAKPGPFYAVLAERLEERRWFEAAEQFYKKATELRPMLQTASNGLGLLYMRMGREAEARDLLSKAFEADPFNVRVSNTLKVLRHLDKYETLKTAHFELLFDAKNDGPLARMMAEALEATYEDLAEKFQYKAKSPILVEVFNSHEMFSGRTIALPDLHTIGACTGKMVAMASTHAKGIRKPFNWGRVVRHELVHIFNLEQTHYLVPHWFTEGLAVINEGYPRPQQWNQLLLERVPAGELMTLDNIDLGFIRPRSPLDWHMAYCQSQLYVEYLKSKYGAQTVGEMLVAFGDGLDAAAALKKVCKVEKADFEKGYRAYVEEIVKTQLGKPAEKALTLAELKSAHEKEPENADLSARLAERLVLQGEKVDARKLVETVLAKQKHHPLASVVKARLLLQGGDEDGAKALLEAALDKNNPEPKLLRELAKLYYNSGQVDKAGDICELGRRTEPYESHWLSELARVYAQTEEKTKLASVLKDLVPTDADDLDHRKRLARLLVEGKQFTEAEKYARQCLEIDVRDEEVHELIRLALQGQKKDQEAEKIRKLLAK
jgi:tetratricopeptide (TPR) repeat protein